MCGCDKYCQNACYKNLALAAEHIIQCTDGVL